MSRYLFFGILVFIAACNKPENITAEEASATISRFDHAWKAKNAEGVDSVLAERYIYFTQSGGVFDRANLVKTAGSQDYLLDTMFRDQVSIVIQGNTAVVNTTWFGRGRYYGKPFDDKQRCSVTLIKENGEVRILSEHCTPMR